MPDMILPAELWIFLGSSLAKTMAVIGVALFAVAYTVMAERRFSSMFQDRIGPNRTGIPLPWTLPWKTIPIQGFGQPVADAFKLLLKEEFTPAHVNKVYFTLAPTLAMIPPLFVLCVVPFGSSIDLRPIAEWISEAYELEWSESIIASFHIPAVVADVNVGILLVFAIVSLSVYGIVLAGWASNSKYSFLGGIRSSAQMISYELTMGLAVVPVFLIVGNISLTQVVEYQALHGWLALPFWPLDVKTFVLWLPLLFSFILFTVSSFAETNRLPFDLPESEQELVGGYHTEYSAMKFGMFFLGEYAAMIVASSMIVTVFLGGWSLPFPWFNGEPVGGMAMPWWFTPVHILVFVAKVAAFLFFFIWVRWTLPRFRYDQLMNLGWKVMIPLAFINVFLTAGLLVLMYGK